MQTASFSVDGFREFVDFVGGREIDPDVAKGVRIGLAQGGLFLPSNETTLILKKDETSLLDTPVNLLKEVTDRQFRGGDARPEHPDWRRCPVSRWGDARPHGDDR